MTRRIDIVVCVYNAYEDVSRCLQSLQLVCRGRTEVRFIIVDDGSDELTRDLTQFWTERNENALLLRNETAGGYTKACNKSLEAVDADIVVFLNSDTIVPTTFVEKIVRPFEEDKWVGGVGPLSNAATFQSVPKLTGPDGKFFINSLPDGVDVNLMDEICGAIARRNCLRIGVPIINGFAFGVRTEAISKIGRFDEENFPFGYGEENDYCFRLTDAGYRLVIIPDLYIYHAKSKSFGSSRRAKLVESGKLALDRKYSNDRQKRASRTLRKNPKLALLREHLSEALNDLGETRNHQRPQWVENQMFKV